MAHVEPDMSVFKEIVDQPEFNEEIWQYINRRVSDWRVIHGKEALKRNAALFSRIERDFGVERGTLLAAQAGYAASGLMEFLQTLAAAQSKPENQRAFGQLLATHPPFNERIARLQPIVAKADKNGKTLDARFQASLK